MPQASYYLQAINAADVQHTNRPDQSTTARGKSRRLALTGIEASPIKYVFVAE